MNAIAPVSTVMDETTGSAHDPLRRRAYGSAWHGGVEWFNSTLQPKRPGDTEMVISDLFPPPRPRGGGGGGGPPPQQFFGGQKRKKAPSFWTVSGPMTPMATPIIGASAAAQSVFEYRPWISSLTMSCGSASCSPNLIGAVPRPSHR